MLHAAVPFKSSRPILDASRINPLHGVVVEDAAKVQERVLRGRRMNEHLAIVMDDGIGVSS